MHGQVGNQNKEKGASFEEDAVYCAWNSIVPEQCLRGVKLVPIGDDGRQGLVPTTRESESESSSSSTDESLTRAAIAIHPLPLDEFEIHVLRQVTLGVAVGEIDLMVVRVHVPSLLAFQTREISRRVDSVSEWVVEVVAIVEVKRNIDDLGHAYRNKQHMVTFLAGDVEHYERDSYRVKVVYPKGEFVRPPQVVVHTDSVSRLRYPFNTHSFRLFERDAHHAGLMLCTDAATQRPLGDYMEGMYYVAKRPSTSGVHLRGLSSASLNRLLHRVSSDRHFSLDDEAYVKELYDRVCGEVEDVDAAAVINHCLCTGYATHMLFLDRWLGSNA